MLQKEGARVRWQVAIAVCAAMCAVARGATAQETTPVSGVVRTRTIKVDTNRLVALLGGEATTPEKVFAVPIERLVALGKTSDSGVTVEERAVRVRGARLRIDGVGSDPQSFVLVDAEDGSIRWAHPKESAYVEWRKPAKNLSATPSAQPHLEPLDRSETIHGFATRGYRVGYGDSVAWVWLANEPAALASVLRAFAAIQNAVRPVPESGEEAILPAAMKLGVPVRVQTLSPQGYTVQEIVAFERKSWPPADFAVASGWKAIPVDRAHERTPATPCPSCP